MMTKKKDIRKELLFHMIRGVQNGSLDRFCIAPHPRAGNLFLLLQNMKFYVTSLAMSITQLGETSSWTEKDNNGISAQSEKPKQRQIKLPIQTEILPPDISDGLGRNQVKRDLNSLGKYTKDSATWMVNRNELHIFDESHWRKLGLDDAIRYIRDICSKHQDIAEVMTNSEYKKLYSDLLHDPDLYEGEELISPPGVVNFRDNEIDFRSNPPNILKHNPSHYFMSYIDVSAEDVLNSSTRGETFERFVSHISNGDERIRTQLLELLSVALTGDQVKHFFVLLGPSNSGKTQWGRFMQELLGHDQVEAVRGIYDLGDRWTTGRLARKKLGLCLDLPNKVLPANAIGMIKQFCGDDPIKGEDKYKDSYTYYQKPLLLFAGNHPIRLPNAHKEEAFWNRMIVVPFANPVQEEEMELDLYKKLLDEAPYIIREEITAYQELAARNFVFTRTDIPLEYQQSGSYSYDSIRDFIQHNLEEQDGAGVSTKELHEAFCIQSGQDVPINVFSTALSAAIHAVFPHAERVKRINKAGDRGYRHIGFISGE